jgi:leader peptidase (prepilin peptidase)/N-methyltransferase
MRLEFLDGWVPLMIAAPFVGSFVGLLVARLPALRPVVFARSVCESCNRRLGPTELIPLLSWALQRGRCVGCGARIDWLVPGLELAALVVPVWASLVDPPPPIWPTAVLGWTLLCLAAIDARHYVLPDVLTLPLVAAGLVFAALDSRELAFDHCLAAIADALLFLAVRAGYQAIRGREGLGLGDVKLMAAAGAWVGLDGSASVVLVGAAVALAGVAAKRLLGGTVARDEMVPFGSYLCAAIWLVWLYGPIGLG